MPGRPMVMAYHLIWTIYGYWLPNDPRGSTSRSIASKAIAELGELHYGRKRIQPSGRELEAFRKRAEPVLKYSVLPFTEEEIAIVGEAFGAVVARERYTCYACAIMPDHIHVLIRKHRHTGERMIATLQEASRLAIVAADRCRFAHPVWGGPGWKIFLDSSDDIRPTSVYIEKNPEMAALPPQAWAFVKQYQGACLR